MCDGCVRTREAPKGVYDVCVGAMHAESAGAIAGDAVFMLLKQYI